MKQIFYGAEIFDGQRFLKDHAVLIENEEIIAVMPASERSSSTSSPSRSATRSLTTIRSTSLWLSASPRAWEPKRRTFAGSAADTSRSTAAFSRASVTAQSGVDISLDPLILFPPRQRRQRGPPIRFTACQAHAVSGATVFDTGPHGCHIATRWAGERSLALQRRPARHAIGGWNEHPRGERRGVGHEPRDP